MAASGFVAFMSLWMMPLFFLVAGAASFLALKSRSSGQYALERTLRLFIPFIFGMLIIVVPQAYFQALYQGENLSGFNIFQIYWLYLQTLPDFNTFHLWFLLDLFLFSIISIPLFFSYGSDRKSLMARVAGFFNNAWVFIIMLVLLMTIINVFLYPEGYWGYRNGGWNIVIYFIFFISGYVIFANPRIMDTVKKYRLAFLGTGIIMSVIIFTLLIDELADPLRYYGSASFAIASLLHVMSSWSWIFAILGFGYQLLNRTDRFLTYANEAVLPFYILHQTVIIVIGYYVVQWNTGVGFKYLFITITSFMGIMLIYELLVRRINILRFLFGMRQSKKPGVMPVSKS